MLERTPATPRDVASVREGATRDARRPAAAQTVRGCGTRAARLAPHGETVPRPTRRGGGAATRPAVTTDDPAASPEAAGRPSSASREKVLAARVVERQEERTSVAPVRANYAPTAAAGPVATLRASVCVTCPHHCGCFWPRGARAGAVRTPGRPSKTPPDRESGGCGSAHAPPATPRCAQRVWPPTAGGARTWGEARGCVCDAYRLLPTPRIRTIRLLLYEATAKRQAQRSASTPG